MSITLKNKPDVKKPLTEKQSEVWAFILGYFSDNGYMPTMREISEYIKSIRQTANSTVKASRQLADDYISKLENKGYIFRPKNGKSRSIELIL